jgi:hypothetical protein
VIPATLYRQFPALCAGIVTFDMYIANCDRNEGNITVDNPLTPTEVHVFDHERALFYIYKGEGVQRLESRVDRLGVTDGTLSGNRPEVHVLVDLIEDADLFKPWLKKIEQIPDWFIEEICEQVWQISISEAEKEAVITFLKNRRKALPDLITSNWHRFPRISNRRLFI